MGIWGSEPSQRYYNNFNYYKDFLDLYLAPERHIRKAVEDEFQAIEAVRQEDFDLVLAEVSMRKMDGLQTFREIESVIEAMREGAYDYIVKPFNIEELRLIDLLFFYCIIFCIEIYNFIKA